MINCKCPICSVGYTVELDLFALARTWGVPLEVATARSWSSKAPLGINVKCPQCGHTCDISVANTANKPTTSAPASTPSSKPSSPTEIGAIGMMLMFSWFAFLIFWEFRNGALLMNSYWDKAGPWTGIFGVFFRSDFWIGVPVVILVGVLLAGIKRGLGLGQPFVDRAFGVSTALLCAVLVSGVITGVSLFAMRYMAGFYGFPNARYWIAAPVFATVFTFLARLGKHS